MTFSGSTVNAHLETVTLADSIALTRNLDLQVEIGASRIDSAGLTLVALDPAIAAIIGKGTAIVTFSRALFIPLENARPIRRFRNRP